MNTIATQRDLDESLERAAASSQVLIVDFFTEWCRPCKMLAPRLERLAEKNPSLCIVKVDCDRSDELTSGFSIQTVPTIAMFYAGNQIGMLRGGSLEQIKQTIESLTPVRVDIMNC